MKIIISTLFAFVTFFTQLEAIIIDAPNLDQFEQVVKTTDLQSLVLFDVDETLLLPSDLILNPYVRETFKQIAQETLFNSEIERVDDHRYFWSRIFSRMNVEVVDLKLIDIVHSLQKKNIKTIAFTRMFTGSFGVIPSMEDWRIGQLKELQFDFRLAFPHIEEMILEMANTGKPSLFKQGVLCANGQAKGPVLLAFLEGVQWKPRQVIFLDNRLDYLESVESALEGSGIEFIGFHYRDVENREHIVNEPLARFQLMHLAKTGEWLSDQEALTILSN